MMTYPSNMAEKKGDLIKLKYDFNESLSCEIQSGDNRVRITAREFRSWNGERYLQGNVYEGPIYYYATNEMVKKPHKWGIIFKHDVDPRQAKQPRPRGSFQF